MFVCLQRVRLHFIRFELEEGGFDTLSIHDGNSTAAVSLIDSVSGMNVPKDVTSSTNIVFVIFQSDYSVTKAGFRIIYRAVRGMALTTCIGFFCNVLNCISDSFVSIQAYC